MLQSKYLTEHDLKDFGFKSIGKNVRISSDARIYGQENISIGDYVRIDDFVTLSASRGFIEIRGFNLIAKGCHLSAPFGIIMEEFSGIAAFNVFYSGSDDFSGDYLTGQAIPQEYTNQRGGIIRLGRHCNTGSNVTILGPASIGEGSNVGALSLVNKDLEPWGMYIGIPARRLKDRKQNLLYLEKKFLESLKSL
jgi:galactoside O-acetyltransferase